MSDAMADLALDAGTVDAQLSQPSGHVHADPWLVRRALAWGASELPIVLALTGRRAVEALPKWMQARAKPIRPWRVPRIYLEKAGIRPPLKAGSAARTGQDREIELLEAWREHLRREEYALIEETTIDVASITHASAVPREWLPLRARVSNHIAATPDAWCRTHGGALYDVECKCVANDVHEAKWIWPVQVQGQGMATGSEGAIVVAGSRWARDARRRDDGPVVRCFVEPDERMRAELAEAAAEAWAEVERLRAIYGSSEMPKEEADNADGSVKACA